MNDMDNTLPVQYFSTVVAKTVEWLWFPYIPYGKITVIQGDPGDGKTTLILNIAALLSKGQPMPNAETAGAVTKIIYQSAEDGAEDTIKPRLLSAGANCEQIAFINEPEQGLTLNDARLEATIRETGARVMVVDPLQGYLRGRSEMNRAAGIRPIMKRLAEIAERTGCAIVIIGHMNKSIGSKSIYRGLGSIDITASARSVLLVGRLKSNPSIRVMAQIKNSLAKEGTPIAFELNEDSGIRWIGEYDISVDELLAGSGDGAIVESGKLSDAMQMLEDILQDGEIACTEIYDRFQETDISKRTVDSAKKMLEVKSIKRTDGWYWSL